MSRPIAPLALAVLAAAATLVGCEKLGLKGQINAAKGKAMYLADRMLDDMEPADRGSVVTLDALPEPPAQSPPQALEQPAPAASAPAACVVVNVPVTVTMGGMPEEARAEIQKAVQEPESYAPVHHVSDGSVEPDPDVVSTHQGP